MFKVNIFIALVSLLSGLGNLIIGYNEENYVVLDIVLAITQVVLALAVVITGVSRAKWFFSSKKLSELHFLTALVFYIFVFSVVVCFL